MTAARNTALWIAFTILIGSEAIAQHGDSPSGQNHAAMMRQHGTAPADDSASDKPIEKPKEFITTHSIKLNGSTLRYTARAEDIYIDQEDGTRRARTFDCSSKTRGRPLSLLDRNPNQYSCSSRRSLR